MEVIEFPGAVRLNKKHPILKKEELPFSPQNNLIINDASFTCPNCTNKTSIKFDNMIFRSIDFHCGKCGTRHKISNPAFSNITSSDIKKARPSK